MGCAAQTTTSRGVCVASTSRRVPPAKWPDSSVQHGTALADVPENEHSAAVTRKDPFKTHGVGSSPRLRPAACSLRGTQAEAKVSMGLAEKSKLFTVNLLEVVSTYK